MLARWSLRPGGKKTILMRYNTNSPELEYCFDRKVLMLPPPQTLLSEQNSSINTFNVAVSMIRCIIILCTALSASLVFNSPCQPCNLCSLMNSAECTFWLSWCVDVWWLINWQTLIISTSRVLDSITPTGIDSVAFLILKTWLIMVEISTNREASAEGQLAVTARGLWFDPSFKKLKVRS